MQIKTKLSILGGNIMVIANKMLDNCFSIRFQNVKHHYEPRTADFVVDLKLRKEFFALVEQFNLIAIYAENDVWHVKPAVDTNPNDLNAHISTWDIMLHKYMSAGNDFKRASEEYHRKKVENIPLMLQIPLDLSGSMA